jgi:hypothetical protein
MVATLLDKDKHTIGELDVTDLTISFQADQGQLIHTFHKKDIISASIIRIYNIAPKGVRLNLTSGKMYIFVVDDAKSLKKSIDLYLSNTLK